MMKHFSLILLYLLVVLRPVLGSETTQDVIHGAFLFEMESGEAMAAFIDGLGDAGTVRLRMDYKLFKGVSVQIHDMERADSQARTLASGPGVKNFWPVALYDAPEPEVKVVGEPRDFEARVEALERRNDYDAFDINQPDLYAPHIMTQVDRLRAEGYTGGHLKVAVIDSGIDYKHPALGGCFGTGCLVSFGTDLVGDAFTGVNKPRPDADPLDCSGHGTHVAGIIAAQPNRLGFSGAAPGVTLGAYRVFGCKGQSSFDVLISAFNQAYDDGAQIISASIVGANGWKDEPWALAVTRIAQAGVPCLVSSGNDGSKGLFYVSTAANGREVAAIASFDSMVSPSLLHRSTYRVDDGDDVPFGYALGDHSRWKVSLPLWAPMSGIDACEPYQGDVPDLRERIVLVRRGGCVFADKVRHVVARGASYIMFYNNVEGAFGPEVETAEGGLKAAAMVETHTGLEWLRLLREGYNVTLAMPAPAINDSYIIMANSTATSGALSTLTSWGPTWEMDLKPQFGAPGGNILSTYPVALGGYAVLSGTSMACPLAAGIVTLVAEARGGLLKPELLTSLLSATAKPQQFHHGTFHAGLAPVAQQGGGLIQAWDAAHASAIITPSSFSFNDSDNFSARTAFTIENLSARVVTYELGFVPALTMYTLGKGSIYASAFPNEIADATAHMLFSEDVVRIKPGEKKSIGVEAVPPQALDASRLPLWSGYVTINGTDGTTLSLPYQGLTGSLHNSTVLAADQAWMTLTSDLKNDVRCAPDTVFQLPHPTSTAYTMQLPMLVVRLALGSRIVRAEVVAKQEGEARQERLKKVFASPAKLSRVFVAPARDGQVVGLVEDFPAMWNSRGTRFFPWAGKLASGRWVGPGRYVVRVRALRIFGNESLAQDWDESETPPFVIKYKT